MVRGAGARTTLAHAQAETHTLALADTPLSIPPEHHKTTGSFGGVSREAPLTAEAAGGGDSAQVGQAAFDHSGQHSAPHQAQPVQGHEPTNQATKPNQTKLTKTN